VDWYKSTSTRCVLRGLGHKSNVVPVKKCLQDPALSRAHGVAEQVIIPKVMPWGLWGWEMKLFKHLSVCRHSSECIKCVCQSWRAYRTQVFAPDKEPTSVVGVWEPEEEKSQLDLFPWKIHCPKNRIWAVFFTEDQVAPAKRGPQKQFLCVWEQRWQWSKAIFLGPSKPVLKQLLEMQAQPLTSPEIIR